MFRLSEQSRIFFAGATSCLYWLLNPYAAGLGIKNAKGSVQVSPRGLLSEDVFNSLVVSQQTVAAVPETAQARFFELAVQP